MRWQSPAPNGPQSRPTCRRLRSRAIRGFAVIGWFGWLAPARTPQEIVGRLNAEMVRILRQPDTRERLVSLGSDPIGNTPQEFAEFIRAERDKWAKLIKQAAIRID